MLERGLSIATLPIIAGAFIVGPNPLIDLALGVVIPWHCHLGFGVILDDYLPKRRNPAANAILLWTLRGGTLLVLIGCFQFNTNGLIFDFISNLQMLD